MKNPKKIGSLIKIINSKTLKQTNARISKMVERLSESEQDMSINNEEGDEDSRKGEIEISMVSENFLEHAKFIFNESEGKKER